MAAAGGGCYACICLFTLLVCCVLQRPDEEVVVDQGGTSSVLNIHYEKEELEGEGRLVFIFFLGGVEMLPSCFSPGFVSGTKKSSDYQMIIP